MKNNKLWNFVFVAFLIIYLFNNFGCSTTNTGTSGKSEKAVGKKIEVIDKAKKEISNNEQKKLDGIGILSVGVEHALQKEKNPSEPVNVASELNKRVISLANNPTIEEVQKIEKIVDDLTSQIKKEKEEGRKKINQLYSQLSDIQEVNIKLKKSIEDHEEDLKKAALKIAEVNDKNVSLLDDMNKWFGLGAIWYGTKKLIFSVTIAVVVCVILFFILKLLSSTNPIAAAIFSVFENIAAMFLKMIRSLTPKAFNVAKYVESGLHDRYKNTLCKAVDVIEMLLEKESASGKKYTLQDMLDQFSKSMDDDQKAVIDECKAEMKWKKI